MNTTGSSHHDLGPSANGEIYELFFQAIELMVSKGISLVVEAAFQHKLWAPKLEALRDRSNMSIVICSPDPHLARSRYIKRGLADPTREWFHGDGVVRAREEEEEGDQLASYEPPGLSVPTLTVDTTDGYRPGMGEIVSFVMQSQGGEPVPLACAVDPQRSPQAGTHLEIRSLTRADPKVISAAFSAIGWDKPTSQYERYLNEQTAGDRHVLVAELDGKFAGYATIKWQSRYAPFVEKGIPEVQDFNVLPDYRRRGIGTSLMDRAEELISERSNTAGIGVGLYPDYGNAQRLYVSRGYVPDGRGLTYKCEVLEPMEQTVNDDDLVLYFMKSLKGRTTK